MFYKMINPFDTLITRRTLGEYVPQQVKADISEDDVIAYVKMMDEMAQNKRIIYGRVGDTSMQYVGSKVKADCFGLLAILAHLVLDNETYKRNKPAFAQKTSEIYKYLTERGETWDLKLAKNAEGNLVIDLGDEPRITTLFVENNRKPGYDHVALIIKDYPMTDENGKVSFKNVIVQIGPDINFRIDDVEEYLLEKCTLRNKKNEIIGYDFTHYDNYKMGDQLSVINEGGNR